MIKLYTPEQIEAIEKVQRIFKDLHEKRDDIDLVYSEKAGYIMLFGIRAEEGYMAMDPMFIETADDLFDFYLYEIACEVFSREFPGNMKDVHESNEKEKEVVMKEFEKYFIQAPEYRYLSEKQFMPPANWKNYDNSDL